MTLADYSRMDLCVELHGGDVAAVLCELSQALERAGAVPDALATFHAAMNRHFLSDRDLFPGVGCACATLPALAQPVFAIGRCVTPLTWRVGDSPVDLVVLVATPTTEARPALLVALARLTQDHAAIRALETATDGAAMREVLAAFPGAESELLALPGNANV